MKTNIRTVVLAIPALAKLSEASLTLKMAYRLKKNVDKLQKEADFFGEERRKILDKYGKQNENREYVFDGDNEQKAITELEALLDMEIEPEVDVLRLPISENITISVNDMERLSAFIEFYEEGN